MTEDGRPPIGPGYCSRCHREVSDAMLVDLIERGSGPPDGVVMCVRHARERVAQAPQYVGAWVARDLKKLDGQGDRT